MLNKLFIIVITTILLHGSNLLSQQYNWLSECRKQLTKEYIPVNKDYSVYLSDNNKGKLNVTFFGGNVYRIVTCTELENSFILNLYDKNGNQLFSNQFKRSSFWDFEFNSAINCTIEIKPTETIAKDGHVHFHIGFKNKPSQ